MPGLGAQATAGHRAGDGVSGPRSRPASEGRHPEGRGAGPARGPGTSAAQGAAERSVWKRVRRTGRDLTCCSDADRPRSDSWSPSGRLCPWEPVATAQASPAAGPTSALPHPSANLAGVSRVLPSIAAAGRQGQDLRAGTPCLQGLSCRQGPQDHQRAVGGGGREWEGEGKEVS